MARRQWTLREAHDWYGGQPWPVGCNFIPSTAVNQLEMWQPETFDSDTIDRELGWAADLGFNAVRVYLHDIPWHDDAEGFAVRIDHFLSIAAQHGIRTLFVLFDGVWDPLPRGGKQPPPRPHLHNPGWAQSPGAEILGDSRRHDELEGFVTGVIVRFADDERVLGWDLFNEPDNPNPAYAATEIPDKAGMALALLGKAYGWARAAGPTQPITSGVWRPDWALKGETSEMDTFQLTESDVISFHAYTGPRILGERIAELEAYGRPTFLTEYLARPFRSTFESILPIAKEHRIGAFNWGLVAGKTQTQYPWDSWATGYDAEPEIWFHDIFRADGTPFDPAEVETIRGLTRPDR